MRVSYNLAQDIFSFSKCQFPVMVFLLFLTTRELLVNKTDLRALILVGPTWKDPAGTRPPSSTTPWQPTNVTTQKQKAFRTLLFPAMTSLLVYFSELTNRRKVERKLNIESTLTKKDSKSSSRTSLLLKRQQGNRDWAFFSRVRAWLVLSVNNEKWQKSHNSRMS